MTSAKKMCLFVILIAAAYMGGNNLFTKADRDNRRKRKRTSRLSGTVLGDHADGFALQVLHHGSDADYLSLFACSRECFKLIFADFRQL